MTIKNIFIITISFITLSCYYQNNSYNDSIDLVKRKIVQEGINPDEFDYIIEPEQNGTNKNTLIIVITNKNLPKKTAHVDGFSRYIHFDKRNNQIIKDEYIYAE